MYKRKLKIIQYNIFNIIPFNKSSPMKNYSCYLPHIASKILKTMTLPCAICCSHCHMTLRLYQLPCGIVTCHCHVLLSLPHGTECTATAMWQKKVTTSPLVSPKRIAYSDFIKRPKFLLCNLQLKIFCLFNMQKLSIQNIKTQYQKVYSISNHEQFL